MKILHKTLIASALTAATIAVALPGVASADCYRRSENGTNGAILGAVAGAAIGNGVSSRHSRGAGTAAGAVLGAVVGSSIARDNTNCYYDGYRDTGYYDNGYRGGYGYSRVYVEPRPYVRERVYVTPGYRYDRRDYRHHDRHDRW